MKRTVSLLLAVVLILSLAVGALAAVASAASRFTDWENIEHQSEVAMLTDLGLLSGYADGSFRPYNCITRAEIAKIISGLLTDRVPVASNDRFPIPRATGPGTTSSTAPARASWPVPTASSAPTTTSPSGSWPKCS